MGSRILALCSLAVMIVSGPYVPAARVSAEETAMNPALKTIFSRKSVRAYKNTPVPDETFTLLVKAGMAAPTAVDKRPWEFVIITDRPLLKQLAAALPYARMAEQSAGVIIVSGDIERQFGGPDSQFWIMDCSAATENILLAAESLGLGAVWTAVYPDNGRVAAIRKILGMPDRIIPLSLIPVGVPEGNPKPKDKYNAAQIHRNRW